MSSCLHQDAQVVHCDWLFRGVGDRYVAWFVSRGPDGFDLLKSCSDSDDCARGDGSGEDGISKSTNRGASGLFYESGRPFHGPGGSSMSLFDKRHHVWL